jgi:hypothetical protein
MNEIINALPRLSESERGLVLKKLRELSEREQAAPPKEQTPASGVVNLKDRGIGEAQASELCARLGTFAQDWNRPEACIYDENAAR